jgi:Sec-independent protein secretion pathway component TatC
LSFVGSVSAIAQVGTLFRIGAVLAFNIMFNTIIVPRYSETAKDKKNLIDKMIKIQFTTSFSLELFLFFGVKSNYLVYLVPNYAG